MPQTVNSSLGVYDPLIYAQEFLRVLKKNLGISQCVNRRYEKAFKDKGSTVDVPIPADFAAVDVNTSTGSTSQDITPSKVTLKLDKWKEVSFGVTDMEARFAGDKIIDMQFERAVAAMVEDIESSVYGLWYDVPWVTNVTATPVKADITKARKILAVNKAPVTDDQLFMVVGPDLEEGFLNIAEFTQLQGAGDQGLKAQVKGMLGQKFGFNVLMSQVVSSYLTGGDADVVGALNGAHTKGVSTISVNALGATTPVKKGDTFVIAGHTQRYVVTADATASTNAIAALAISPPLVQNYSGGAVVTFDLPAAGTVKIQNLAFHRDAFALVMAPLSDAGNELGARVATVNDPDTGLALRSRIWYDAAKSTVRCGIDALWGVKTLNPNLAVRMQG